eukprot:7161057-Ditylum_brightwellii.AAC.1
MRNEDGSYKAWMRQQGYEMVNYSVPETYTQAARTRPVPHIQAMYHSRRCDVSPLQAISTFLQKWDPGRVDPVQTWSDRGT